MSTRENYTPGTWENRILEIFLSTFLFLIPTALVSLLVLVFEKAMPSMAWWFEATIFSSLWSLIMYFLAPYLFFVVDEDETIVIFNAITGTTYQFTTRGIKSKCPWESIVSGSEDNNQTFSRDLQSVFSDPIKNEYNLKHPREKVNLDWVFQYRNDPEMLGARNVTPTKEIENGIRAVVRTRIQQIMSDYDSRRLTEILPKIEEVFALIAGPIKDPAIEERYGIEVVAVLVNNFKLTADTQAFINATLEASQLHDAIIAFVGGQDTWNRMSPDKQQENRVLFMARKNTSQTAINTRGRGGSNSATAAAAAAAAAIAAAANNNNND